MENKLESKAFVFILHGLLDRFAGLLVFFPLP